MLLKKIAPPVIRYGPAVVWMAVIFYLSHQPGSELESYLPFFQRLFPQLSSFNAGHYAAYFVLALTYYWAIGPTVPGWKGRLAALILSVLYGFTDEFHQMFVPDRTADWLDIRSDFAGALAAMILASLPPVRRTLARLMAAAGAKKYMQESGGP